MADPLDDVWFDCGDGQHDEALDGPDGGEDEVDFVECGGPDGGDPGGEQQQHGQDAVDFVDVEMLVSGPTPDEDDLEQHVDEGLASEDSEGESELEQQDEQHGAGSCEGSEGEPDQQDEQQLGQTSTSSTKVGKAFSFGPRATRTAEQHHALTAKMREAKMKATLKRKADEFAGKVTSYVEQVSVKGLLRSNVELVAVPAKGGFGMELKVISGKSRYTARGSHTWRFAPPTMLRLAYENIGNTTLLGKLYECDRATARQLCELICSVYMAHQTRLLDVLLTILARKPFFAIHRVKWDETSEKLGFGAGLATREQGISSWHVLISRHRFIIGMMDNPDELGVIDVVAPPVPLLATRASNIYNGLYHHPLTRGIEAFRKRLAGMAEEFASVREADGASSNDRLNAYCLMQDDQSVFLWCRSHSNHLIQVAMVALLGLKVFSSVASWALFMHSGAHFIRLVASVRTCVATHFRPSAPQPVGAKLFNKELRDYLLCNFKGNTMARMSFKDQAAGDDGGLGDQDKAAGDQDKAASWQRRCEAFAEKLDECFEVFDGVPWEGGLQHRCKGPSCCGGDCKARMARVISGVVIPSLPGVPSPGKWTRLGKPLDMLILGLLLHNVMLLLFRLAFSSFNYRPAEADAEDAEDMDSWHRVAGLRLKRTMAMLESPLMKLSITLLGVVTEPVRALTYKFIHCSAGLRGRRTQADPGICAWANPRTSPVVAALQHISTMMRSGSGRLRLIWGACGCASLREFAAQHREFAWLARRALLASGAWMYIRHRKVLEAFPWKLSLLVDRKVPPHAQAAVAREWRESNSCCLPPGVCRSWHQRRPKIKKDDIVTSKWKGLVRAMCHAVSMSIADVESVHAGNRARAHMQMSWGHFAACCANSEAQHNKGIREAQAQPAGQLGENDRSMQRFPLRGRNPLMEFRQQYMDGLSLSGRQFNPASTEFWEEVKLAFRELPAHRREDTNRKSAGWGCRPNRWPQDGTQAFQCGVFWGRLSPQQMAPTDGPKRWLQGLT